MNNTLANKSMNLGSTKQLIETQKQQTITNKKLNMHEQELKQILWLKLNSRKMRIKAGKKLNLLQ